MASDVAIRNLLECDAQFLFGVGRNAVSRPKAVNSATGRCTNSAASNGRRSSRPSA
jgi:hypothetical protein